MCVQVSTWKKTEQTRENRGRQTAVKVRERREGCPKQVLAGMGLDAAFLRKQLCPRRARTAGAGGLYNAPASPSQLKADTSCHQRDTPHSAQQQAH